MRIPLLRTPMMVATKVIAPITTVPITIALWRALVFLKLMPRTTDWGRAKVQIPTSIHWLMYKLMGILPRERGSSMSGWLVLMCFIILSKPPPVSIIAPKSRHIPAIIAIAQKESVIATPLKPPMVV